MSMVLVVLFLFILGWGALLLLTKYPKKKMKCTVFVCTEDGCTHEVHIVSKGKENITGIEVNKPVTIKPGTKVTAIGEKNVTALRVGSQKEKDE